MPSGMDIFISYCHQDLDVVTAIESGLRAAGFSVWRDATQMRGGSELGAEIEQAIQSAACVLACLSSASVKSAWVRAEMRRGKGKLLPVRIDRFNTTVDLDADLSGVFYRDITQWVDGENPFPWDQLLADCRALVAKPTNQMSGPPPSPRAKPVSPGVSISNSGRMDTVIGHVQGNVTIGKTGSGE